MLRYVAFANLNNAFESTPTLESVANSEKLKEKNKS
jgi:hypothetical protein